MIIDGILLTISWLSQGAMKEKGIMILIGIDSRPLIKGWID